MVAERVLYMPSMGWCLLVAHGWRLLAKKRAKLAAALITFLLLAFSAKTYVRNWDWKTEYSIFASGLKVSHHYQPIRHAAGFPRLSILSLFYPPNFSNLMSSVNRVGEN